MDDPRKPLIDALAGGVQKTTTPTAAKAPKAPAGQDLVPLAVQPDEHSDYMGKQLGAITKRINTKGQEMMKTRLLKTSSSKSSSKR